MLTLCSAWLCANSAQQPDDAKPTVHECAVYITSRLALPPKCASNFRCSAGATPALQWYHGAVSRCDEAFVNVKVNATTQVVVLVVERGEPAIMHVSRVAVQQLTMSFCILRYSRLAALSNVCCLFYAAPPGCWRLSVLLCYRV